jgi:hypothetical protein
MADGAVSSVAADEPRHDRLFLAPIRVPERGAHFVLAGAERPELDPALDAHAEALEVLLEHALRFPLRHAQDEREGPGESLETNVRDPTLF